MSKIPEERLARLKTFINKPDELGMFMDDHKESYFLAKTENIKLYDWCLTDTNKIGRVIQIKKNGTYKIQTASYGSLGIFSTIYSYAQIKCIILASTNESYTKYKMPFISDEEEIFNLLIRIKCAKIIENFKIQILENEIKQEDETFVNLVQEKVYELFSKCCTICMTNYCKTNETICVKNHDSWFAPINLIHKKS